MTIKRRLSGRPFEGRPEGERSEEQLLHRGELWRFENKLPRTPSNSKRRAASHSATLRSRKALPITETEERLIAKAAIIGESRIPNTG